MAGNTAILSVRIIGDAKGAQKSFDEVDKGLDKTSKNAEKLSAGFAVAGLAAGAALTKGLFDAVDADTALRKLSGQLDLSAADAEIAGRVAGDVYSGAWGDSVEQVNAAVSGVASTLADVSKNGGADLERLTKKSLDLASTFEVDVNEAVNSAGILMKSGLAKDADEAFDLMVASMQKMPAGMRSELLPVMDEYAKHFADLGIDGPTALQLITDASKDGAIAMDKVGDSVKEFAIRASDGSKTTADAYAIIGLSSEDMARKVATGGTEARDAFDKTIDGLLGIEDPAARAQAAIALFGTPLEDLGVAKIPAFLTALSQGSEGMDGFGGASDRLSEQINNGPGVALEELKRTGLLSLQELAAGALPILQPILEKLIEFAPVLGPIAVAIAAVTAAQWLLNIALAANPVGLIILAVVALIGWWVFLYQNVEPVRMILDAVGAVGVAVISAIVTWIQQAVTWFQEVIMTSDSWKAGIELLGSVITLMGEAAQLVWDLIVIGLESIIEWFGKTVLGTEDLQSTLDLLGTAGAIAFEFIDDAISNTVGQIQSAIAWVSDLIGWFQNLLGAKNDAASAGGGGGGGGPMMQAEMMASGASLLSGITMASPSTSLGSFNLGTGGRGDTYVYNTVEVRADATTDRIALGREIRKALNAEQRATGRVG